MFSFLLYSWEKAEGNVVLNIRIYLTWYIVWWVVYTLLPHSTRYGSNCLKETAVLKYPKMWVIKDWVLQHDTALALTWQTCILQSSMMWPTHILYIHKVLLFCYFYCITHAQNHAKLCTRRVVCPYMHVHCRTYNWKMARKCGILCYGIVFRIWTTTCFESDRPALAPL